MPGIRVVALVFAAAAVLVPASATGHASVPTFTVFGSPTVDGVLSPGEWDEAATLEFAAAVPGGGTVPVALRVMNDDLDVFFGIRIGTTTPTLSVALGFDNDHDGVLSEEGDDGVALGFGVRNGFGDLVLSGRGGCPATICGFHDVDLGGVENGRGVRTVGADATHIEISHPLDSTDDANDFSLGPGDVVGFGFQVAICTATFECAFTRPLFPLGGDLEIARKPTPAERLVDLAAAVDGVGPGTSLAAKVARAQQAVARGDAHVAAALLTAFVHEVEAQAGKSIPAAVAAALVAEAARIEQLLTDA